MYKCVEDKEALKYIEEQNIFKKLSSNAGLTNFVHILRDKENKLFNPDVRHDGCFGANRTKYITKEVNSCPYFVIHTNAHYQNYWAGENEKRALPKKDIYAYLEWLANESMFSEAFYTKDPEHIFTRGAILNTHYPLIFAIHAGISTRIVTEAQHLIRNWMALKNIVDPDLAYFLAYRFRFDAERGVFYQTTHRTGHSLFNGIGKKELAKVVNKDLSCMGLKSMSKKPWGYSTFNDMWGDGNETPSHEFTYEPIGFTEIKGQWTSVKVPGFNTSEAKERIAAFIEANSEK